MTPHILLLVGWLVYRWVIISYKGGKLHFRAPKGSLLRDPTSSDTYIGLSNTRTISLILILFFCVGWPRQSYNLFS